MRTGFAWKTAMLGAALLVAPAAHALEMEFYTWNSFEETVAGFQRVALVLQDPGFLVFALVFAVLGTMVGLLAAAAKGIMGQQINPVSVLIPAVIGIAIFRGLIIPTGTLHIYDPVRNAYQPVGDVPDAVILIAGVINKLERGVVEIIETSSADPASERSGSLRYGLVLNALSAKRQDTYFERNASIYFTDCGLPSMGMGYNGASLNAVLRNSTDLVDQFAQWAHPSVYATLYTGVGDQKATMSCKNAWDDVLKPTAQDGTQFGEMVASICRTGGFDPSVAAQAARCEEELTSLQSLYGLAATQSLPFVRSVVFAQAVSDAMRDADVSVQQGALVNRQVMAEGFGAAEAMDRWVPKLRGFMTATVLGLIPLVCLFMLTPVMGKALSLAVGLFLWLALWGVTDAISTQMAADSAADAFDQISRFGLSYDSLMLSPEAAIQALGVFGKARTMALMLATVLSYGLFSFGGYAFTSMAQAWQSDLQQAGEAAGRTALSPEERGALLGRLTSAVGPEAAMDRSGFPAAAAGASMGDVRSAASAAALRPYVGLQVGGHHLPGGAGGTDTTPTAVAMPSTSPGDTPPANPAASYVSDRVNGLGAVDAGAPAVPGGAGGTNTTPATTRPSDTRPRGADASGEANGPPLAEITVAASSREPRTREGAARSVLDFANVSGEISAGQMISERGAYSDLARERGTDVAGAVGENVRTRTDAQIYGNEALRAGLDSQGLDGRDAGLQSGGLEAGGVVVREDVQTNLGLGVDRTTESSLAQARFQSRGELAASEVLGSVDRGINVERTAAEIHVAQKEEIASREMATRVGHAAGVRDVIEAQATEGSIREYGEPAIVAGRVVDQGFSVFRAEAIEAADGSTAEVQRGMVSASVAQEIAAADVQLRTSEALGHGIDMQGRIAAATAQRAANVVVSVDGDEKSELIGHLADGGVLNERQRTLLDAQPGAVVTVSLGKDGPTQATGLSGTRVAIDDSTTVNDEDSVLVKRQFAVSGGAQALAHFDDVLMRAYGGKPAVNELSEGEHRALVNSIAETIGTYGVGVTADSSEHFSYGYKGQAGIGTPGGRVSPLHAGADVNVAQQESMNSGARRDYAVDLAEQALASARADAIAEFQNREPTLPRTEWDQREFARTYATRVQERVHDAIAAIRDETQSSAESDGTVKRLQEINEASADREADNSASRR